ncbi:ParB/RepB/Spo0J family partition protein [Alistipes sp. ZOR0009]|jgi:ParB family chromosome partitioning protein|uniref:ParB/RepB/Spo0J family partition protein n=1 Tax=Alistipes sp. ZOR0009 TaxID=1339253 RepID=UPI000646214A|nr:ParB/RepB/Spo0J family partition protein [Alistipes sp. ZOR0009]
MSKKMALGRGLGALIEEASTTQNTAPAPTTESVLPKSELINEIEIEKIVTNPYQPRTHFDEDALNELAASIKELGIIQPITVRKVDDNQYQIISGERRFRASKIAGLKAIPAYVRTADDQGMLEMALVENIQREDLDAIEVAISYQRLVDECSLTQEVLGERVGKKRSTVTNYLRLLKLPAEVQLAIRKRLLSMGHARALVNIDDQELQLDLLRKIIEEDLSVRQIEQLVKKIAEGKKDEEDKNGEEDLPDSYFRVVEHLEKMFTSDINIKKGAKGSGKIIIGFKSEKEINTILKKLEQLDGLL